MDVDHPIHHGGVLGEEVVQAKEVAVGRILAGEGRVAAVVIVDGVVEPGRNLDVGFGRRHDRRIGEALGGVQRRERAGAGVVAVVKGQAVGIAIGIVRLAAVAVLVLGVLDDVGRVVEDDVKEHLDAAGVGLGDHVLQLGIGAKMRVKLSEIGDPVAVIAGGVVSCRCPAPACS